MNSNFSSSHFQRILVLLAIVSIPLYIYRLQFGFFVTNIWEVFFYIICILFLCTLAVKKELIHYIRSISQNKITRYLLLYALIFIPAIIRANDVFSGLGFVKAYLIDPALLVFLLWYNFKSQYASYIKAFILSSLLVVIIGFINLVVFKGESRLLSLFPSANFVSLYIVPVVPLYFLIRAQIDNKYRVVADVAMGVIVLGVLLTLSRSGIIALGCFGLYLAWQRLRFNNKRTITIAVCVGTALVFTLGPLVYAHFFADRGVSSDAVRLYLYKDTWTIMTQHTLNSLFGIGLGNFQSIYTQFSTFDIVRTLYVVPHAVTPHNVLLNIWVEFGMIGVLYFIWLGIDISMNLRKKILTDTTASFIAWGFVLILIQGLFEATILKNDLGLYFWFLVLLAIMYITKSGEIKAL